MGRGKVISKAIGMQTSKAKRAHSTCYEAAREMALTALPCAVAVKTFISWVYVQDSGSVIGARRQGPPASATVGSRERLMTLGIIADPVATVQALTVRIAKLAPLALPWRCSPSAPIRPVIAIRVMARTICPGTLEATRRYCYPWLNPRQGSRPYPDIVFLISTLETYTHNSVNTASMYGQCYCWVRYAPNLKDHGISTAENIDRAVFRCSE